MKIRVQFQPRDLWVGVFLARAGMFMSRAVVKNKQGHARTVPAIERRRKLYICAVPMFPIVIEWISLRPIPQNELRGRLLEIGVANERHPFSRQELVDNVLDAIRKHEGEL